MFDLTLSFDNGPHAGVTPSVLDILARRSLKATFFVVGKKLAQPGAREIVARAHAEGHWIGNHTWSHAVPLGEQHDPGAAELEIGRTQDLIGELSHPRRYFRPFGAGGNLDARLLSRSAVDYLQIRRFTCVLWNAIPRDFEDPDGWVERALEQCRAQPWTLMVLHDLPNGAMRHLDLFLQSAADLGARVRQDFPPGCLPVVGGTIVGSLEGLVTGSM